MELHHLRDFVAVAEELHFGRAARRLHMAQPPLSQQVRRLEAELGTPLFVRSRRHVALTAAGAALLPHARRALQAAEQGVEAARRAARGETGRIALGFVGSAMAGPLPAILRAFRAECPDVELALHQMTTAAQAGALRAGELDLGCLRPPLRDPGVALAPILTEALAVALPAGHPAAGQDPVNLATLAAAPFVAPPRPEGEAFADHVSAACAAAGFQPTVAQVATEMSTLLGLVAAGLGVALVPASLASQPRPGVAFRPIGAPAGLPPLTLALAWLPANLSPAAERLVAMARTWAR
jgi:DNA-binding transcriptional LysR family regulator